MEPLAHALAGSAIARAGFQKTLPPARATLVAVVAASIADVDLAELLWASEEQFVYHHRTITHSLLGWLVASASLALFFNRIWSDMALRPLLALISLAYGSHIVMDLLTPWGTRVFYPFSNVPFSGRTTFIVDPGFWIILGAPWIFRSWISEIRAFRFAILFLALFVMLCALNRQVASVGLRHMLHRTQTPVTKTAVYPALFAPVSWNAVAQGETHTHQSFMTLPFGANDFERSLPHNLEHPAVRKLMETHGMDYFLWAQFPVAELNEEPGGVLRVEIRDLRFARRYSGEIGGFVFKRRMKLDNEGHWFEVN